MSKKEQTKRGKHVEVRFPEGLHERLRAHATSRGVTLSAAILTIVADRLDADGGRQGDIADRRYILSPVVQRPELDHVVTKALVDDVLEEIAQRDREARIADLEEEIAYETLVIASLDREVSRCLGRFEVLREMRSL